MKKSLIFWFAAVTCAALVLIGCPTEAETETKYVNVPEVIQEKYVITSDEGAEAALAGYLAEAGDFAVGVYANVTLTGDLTVPAGKIIQLHGANMFDAASSALTVNGKVYVYHEATLKAEGIGKVVIPGSGSVIVRQDGILSVDSADDVNDGADPAATVLGTAKVSFTETSALKLSSGVSVAAIKEVLGLVTVGIVDASASTVVGALKPSAAVTEFGSLMSADKTLVIEANDTESASSLNVPEGLALITDEAFSSGLTTLTVNGTLTASTGTFAAVTTLTVNGTLTSIGTFAALATVAGTGSVTAAVVAADTAKFLIESTLTEVTLGSTAITDEDLVIPVNTVRVFTAAAVPSAAVTVNGTLTVADSLAVTAGKQITVGANGSVTAGLIALGPGTWKATNAGTTIDGAASKITLGSHATATFGVDDGTTATVLTGNAESTNTFTASGGTVTLGQSANKLTITGSVATATLTLGANGGITTKGNLDITTVVVDVSANSTDGIVLAQNDVVTLSNSDSVIKTNSGTTVNTNGIDGLTIGGGVTVKAATEAVSQTVGSITGSASNNTLTATKGVSLKNDLTTNS
jgi:filamentous hemagglutinin